MSEPRIKPSEKQEAQAHAGDVVYLLWHKRPLGEDETDDPSEADDKLIGVYSSTETARLVQERLTPELGFRDYPEDFHADRFIVDETLWGDGFLLDDPDADASPTNRG